MRFSLGKALASLTVFVLVLGIGERVVNGVYTPNSRAQLAIVMGPGAVAALKQRCPESKQYDYTCDEGEKSKDPAKTCTRGKEVQTDDFIGECNGPGNVRIEYYKDFEQR